MSDVMHGPVAVILLNTENWQFGKKSNINDIRQITHFRGHFYTNRVRTSIGGCEEENEA